MQISHSFYKSKTAFKVRITRNTTQRNMFLSNDGKTNLETEPKRSLSIQVTDELRVYAESHIIKTERIRILTAVKPEAVKVWRLFALVKS